MLPHVKQRLARHRAIMHPFFRGISDNTASIREDLPAADELCTMTAKGLSNLRLTAAIKLQACLWFRPPPLSNRSQLTMWFIKSGDLKKFSAAFNSASSILGHVWRVITTFDLFILLCFQT